MWTACHNFVIKPFGTHAFTTAILIPALNHKPVSNGMEASNTRGLIHEWLLTSMTTEIRRQIHVPTQSDFSQGTKFWVMRKLENR